MKSNAPWSVKGIERDARETAKEAARREGMTVGEWLNQMIYSAGDPESSGGKVEGLKIGDLVTAIEHLNKRLGEAESLSAEAVGELSRNIGGVVERLQRLERVKPAAGTYDDLANRLGRLENASGARHRIDALKALEKAVAQVAVQFNTAHKTSLQRLDANERQLQELAARLDQAGRNDEDASGVSFLKDAIDGLSARIARAERIAGEAAKLKDDATGSVDPEFVERTGARLRVLGDEIKRGGDQIRSLEATIAKLSEQIDAAESRSAEGVQKATETIAELRGQLSDDTNREADRAEIGAMIAAARQETDERITALQTSFDNVVSRLETLDGQAGESLQPDEAHDADTVTPLSFDIADDADDQADEAEDLDAAVKTDDAFVFADVSEPPKEEKAAGAEASDDFSFDFDDSLDDDDNAEDGENVSAARSLLSEVQEAFSAKKRTDDSEENSPTDEFRRGESENDGIDADISDDEDGDDLDSIFADLDALTAAAASPAQQTAPQSDDNAPFISIEQAAVSKDAASAHPDKPGEEDYLKAARRRAKEAVQRTAEDGKPVRRMLSAKQKAILAARARQKRRATAEAAVEDKPQTALTESEITDARGDVSAEAEKPAGRLAKISAALASVGNRVGRHDTSGEEDAYAQQHRLDEPRNDGGRAAFATLKATATARPLTLGLGVGIILAVAALFFLVKDLVYKPGEADPRAAISTTQPAATVTDSPPADAAGSASDPGVETVEALPMAPAVNPRQLYIESISDLNAAQTDAETAAAIAKLQDAAALGSPQAQLQLGELYKTGQGVDQDLGQARTWFRRAANGGNVLAMHRIGVMTARGDGGAADTREAIGWFERAANFGLVDSQYNLGAIYHPSDNGASSAIQDAGEAYYWYSLAAKNGDPQAPQLAAGVAVALTPAERQVLDTEIANWSPQTPDPDANEIAATN